MVDGHKTSNYKLCFIIASHLNPPIDDAVKLELECLRSSTEESDIQYTSCTYIYRCIQSDGSDYM
jgi:hypothetical protein